MAYAIRGYATNRLPDPAWIGPIPSHWQVKRLKYTIAALESGVSVNATDLPAGNEELGVLKTSCVYTGEFRASENKTVVPDELGRVRCPVREQAIIISRMNTPDLVGASGLVTRPHDNLFLPDRLWQTVFRPEAEIAARYVAYFLGTEGFRKQVSLAAEGASSSMQNVAKPDFLAIPTTIPPREEQTQIAKFLDYETAKIDALIEKQQQLIALLKEKRQAVISHAVTKGLNPDAPMRDSGVEWLGKVPAHWATKRLKHISPRVGVGLVINPSIYTKDEGVYFLFGGDVNEYRFDLTNTRRMSPEDSDRLTPSRLSAGDLVSVRVGDPGVTAVVPPELEGANCASVVIVRRGDFDSGWLCSAMNSWVGRQQVGLVAYGAAQKQFNISDAVEFRFPIPPREEQEAISCFITDSLTRFDKLSDRASEAVELLKERRTALISAAVTGKIDVRGWKPPDSKSQLELA